MNEVLNIYQTAVNVYDIVINDFHSSFQSWQIALSFENLEKVV